MLGIRRAVSIVGRENKALTAVMMIKIRIKDGNTGPMHVDCRLGSEIPSCFSATHAG